MTLHVTYTHQCGECQAFYIPYDRDVPCPRCGQVEEERFDFIPQAAASMRYNKEWGGSYTPGAWFVGSLGDHLLHLLFGIFDDYVQQPENTDFEQYLAQTLDRLSWGDQDYMRSHVQAIAVRLRQELGLR
jgi:hypothetical protein